MKTAKRFCVSLCFPILFVFQWFDLFSQAMNDPNLYADSMRYTAEGIALYDSLMTIHADDTSQTAMAISSESGVWYHYVHQWYVNNPLPSGPQGDDDGTMCYNWNFDETSQDYDEIAGYKMFDGSNMGLHPLNCDVSDIPFIPLPEMAFPQPPPNNNFRFDLNPNNNGNIFQLSVPDRERANYHSMELMNDEDDYNLFGIIKPISPTGNRSIRINNDWTKFHVNKLARTFLVDEQNPIYYFSFSVLMQEPINHPLKDKPFFKAQMVDANGGTIDEMCLVSSVDNDAVQIWPGEIPAEPFTYTQWQCDSFDLSGYEDQWVTIEFIASDCAEGAHWGYVYVSNICVPCSEIPSISLNPIDTSCNHLPIEVCGNLYLPNDYELQTLKLEIWHNQNRHKILTNPVHDVQTGNFCFSIDASDLTGLPVQGYDVYAVAELINPNNDPATVRSVSANPNTGDINNDFYIGLKDDECLNVEFSNDCKDSTKYYVQITYDPTSVYGLFEIDIENIVGNLGGSNFATDVVSFDPITGNIFLQIIPGSLPDSCPYLLTLTIPYIGDGEFIFTREVCPVQCFKAGEFNPEILECYNSSELITVCGEYLPPSTDLGNLELISILISYHNLALGTSGIIQPEFDIDNNILCFTGDFLSIEGCYEIQITLNYEASNGDKYFYTVGEFSEGEDNDICFNPNGCCPDSLFLVWMADLNNMTCLDAGSSGEKQIAMEFVLYFPDGYVDCENEPVFEDGYFDYNDYTYSSITNSIHVEGIYHITDIEGFDEDYVIRGTIDLCKEGDSTICPATFEIAKIDCHSNCSEDPCADGVECNATLDVTYVHGGWTYLTYCVYLIDPLVECDYGDYDIYIYDEWGIVLSHSVNPARVGINGYYCIEFEYETELEELCFDILIYNDCTELDYCESTICVENEAIWGGGSIESRSENTSEAKFNLIPNPVSTDQIVIISDLLYATKAQISIYGLYGQILYSNINTGLVRGNGKLDIAELSDGYYILKITLPENSEFVQFIPFVVIK